MSFYQAIAKVALALILTCWLMVVWAQPPAHMQANTYHEGMSLNGYWVSEKLDGVRAHWNGKALMSRGGYLIHAPIWFTEGWPSLPMDGELWRGRGEFEITMAVVRTHKPNDEQWKKLRFMAFDMPAEAGTFSERLTRLKTVVQQTESPWLHGVSQTPVSTHAALMERLKKVERQGGEGLMLHRGSALYRPIRSDDLLKVKTAQDAEATVIGHLPGKGKYEGVVGALLVSMADGLEFKIGSGLKDADRRNPPKLGSIITFRYRGLHEKSGKPRFATYLRTRDSVAFEGVQTRSLEVSHR